MKKRGTESRLSNNKGQVTLFIIIGILILLISSIFIYINFIRVEGEIPIIPVIEETTLEAMPIRSYTQTCIYDITEEALLKLGRQGGYIDLDQFGIAVSPADPTGSDGLQFAPNSDLKVPYWWYLVAPNDCVGNCLFSSQRPELKRTTGTRGDSAIESQIDWYIIDNLPDCLNDFAPFTEQGYTIEVKGDISPITIIGESDIGVYVKYPLDVKIENSITEVEQFYVSIPLDLQSIYDLATEITNAQIEDHVLEQQTLNLITNFQSLDEDSLPPKTEATFSFGDITIWSVAKVKKDIEAMLMTYTPGLQVPFTLNYERRSFPGDPVKEATYAMEIPMNFDRTYSDLSARFDYLGWWPIYFNAGEGGIIQPESITALLLPLGFQTYTTTYDISYPVVVTVSDPDALNLEGYSFMFALESNLRNNEPIDVTFEGLEGGYVFQPSLLCNVNQRNSGNITIEAIDESTKEGAEEVQVMYTCGSESCVIGETDENGILTAQFPICYNGIVSFVTADYFAASDYFSTELEKEERVKASLYPYVEKEIEVEKWLYSKELQQLSVNPVNLDLEEEAIVTLKRISNNPGEDDVSATAEFTLDESSTLRLVPGIYEVRIDLFLHKEVIIPEDKREAGGILGIGEEEYIIPEIVFEDNYPNGGVLLNENTGYITISKSDLYADNKITFFAVSASELPTSVEDLADVGLIEDYSARFRQNLKPRYTR